jgi:hypothetical protein
MTTNNKTELKIEQSTIEITTNDQLAQSLAGRPGFSRWGKQIKIATESTEVTENSILTLHAHIYHNIRTLAGTVPSFSLKGKMWQIRPHNVMHNA